MVKIRKPEGDLGKHYERNIISLIAMKCILKNDIQDFWLSTNHADIDKFDDLILHVEYEDNRKEIFFIQLKHKQDGDRPITVDKFVDEKRKEFNLVMYSKAYESIMKLTEFFSTNNISEDTKKFFVIYNNCKVSMHSEDPANLRLEILKKEDFRSFISSNASEDVATEYTIKGKLTETCAEFLSQFYFYAGQLHLKDIPHEMKKLIGLNEHCVDNVIKYFYDFATSKNTVEKLYKQDIKTKLLELIFDGLSPNRSTTEYSLLTVLKKFDVILIYEEYSAGAIWNEILKYMRIHYNEESLELNSWKEALPKKLQNKFRALLNLRAQEQVSIKHLYFHLVAKRILPFYIKSENQYFDDFVKKLMIKLKVFTVILDSKKVLKQDPELQTLRNLYNLKFLENVHDLDREQCFELTSRVQVSLQGKENVLLSNFVDDDENLRKKISIDLLISLLDKNINLGCMRSKAPIYIQRRLKVPVLNESILKNKKYQFIIVCGISNLTEFNSKSLNSFLGSTEEVDEIEEHDDEETLSIFTTEEHFDASLIKWIEKKPNVGLYCVLQFVDKKNESAYRFILKETNGTLELMKSSILCEHVPMTEDELFESNRHSKINIICNKAGMGKTMLLNHISQKFSPSEWVVQIELGKYSDKIEEIVDFDGFITFIKMIEIKTVEERYQIIFELLHQHYIEHGGMVILLDDYEEINRSNLLGIFKEVINNGLKIWMVSRPSLRTELEGTFRMFSMELDEFNKADQDMYFREHISQNSSNDDVENNMRLFEETRSKLESSFIGMCQQTMMLSVVLTDTDNITANRIRIDELYEKFIESQIDQHFSKNKRFIFRILSKLAMFSFFTENVLKKLFDWDEFDCDIEVFREENPKAALIMEFRNNNIPLFSHKTYAEFLTAKWLADTASKQISKQTPFDITEILKLLYCPELTNVRNFFDNILTRNNSALSAVLNNDFSIGSVSNNLHKTDILGRTIYHVIMSYGKRYHIHTVSEAKQALQNYEERADIERDGTLILLKVPELDSKSTANVMKNELIRRIRYSMLFEDNFLGRTGVDYALMSGSLEELEQVLCTDSNIRNVQSKDLFRDMTVESLYFILLHCIKNKFNGIFSKLVILPDIREKLMKIREYQNRMSLLHLAVKYKNWKAGRELVRIHSSIESWGVDKEQNTPLHSACQHTKANSSRALSIFLKLDHYSTYFLNLKNIRGWSHLHYFAKQGNEVWVEKMLEYPGTEVDLACNQGNTPFILSVMKGNLRIAAILKNKGADVNVINKHKMTALHYAASRGKYKCTERLIEWGAKLNVKTNYGATPLIKASSWGRVKIVDLLLTAGANINAVDTNNWTSLHHAVKRRKFRVIEVLVKRRANINAVTNKGHTPLITACIHNVPEAIQILSENLSCIIHQHYRTTEGETALDIAKRKNYEQCVLEIREARSRLFSSIVFEKQCSRPADGQMADVGYKVEIPDSVESDTGSSAKDPIFTGIYKDAYYDDYADYEEEDEDDDEEDSAEESDGSDENDYNSEAYDEYERDNEDADEGGEYIGNRFKFFVRTFYNFCRSIFIQL